MDNLDILLSGTIPPNPTELLSSNKFKSFIEEVRQKYDYVFIDSAPCLLISDTLELSKYVDYTLYVVRSGFSDLKLCDFINDISSNNKIKKINLVLNDVGNNDFININITISIVINISIIMDTDMVMNPIVNYSKEL